ncbi:MAG: FtsX-like permease family protein [Ferruginibacter sp.]
MPVKSLSFKNIAPFLSSDLNKVSRALSYAGLGIGVLLLLCSIQMFININQLLTEKNSRKNGADYISVTKTITNDNMGKDNSFSPADIADIQAQPFIEAAAPLISNQFRVKASAGNIIPFSTDLFLESLDEKFIDTVPPSFTWQPGQLDVPIIFSSDFMEMYNVFAPSQDLPQLSDKTMSSVSIILECYTPFGVQNFKARIVALSDRINSVLVPNTFMTWANKNFGGVSQVNASRIYIKTNDANSPQLLTYLEKKEYRVNKDKTKFGRVKQILQAIVSGLGAFGLLVVIMAMVLFSFYLQLMIAKSKDNLQLLLTLGYSPKWLSKTVAKKWLPVYAVIIITSLILTVLLQFCFQHFIMNGREELSPFIHWAVVLVAMLLLVLSVFTNFKLVNKLLHKL